MFTVDKGYIILLTLNYTGYVYYEQNQPPPPILRKKNNVQDKNSIFQSTIIFRKGKIRKKFDFRWKERERVSSCTLARKNNFDNNIAQKLQFSSAIMALLPFSSHFLDNLEHTHSEKITLKYTHYMGDSHTH